MSEKILVYPDGTWMSGGSAQRCVRSDGTYHTERTGDAGTERDAHNIDDGPSAASA